MIVNWKKTKRDLKRKYHLGNYKKDIVDNPSFASFWKALLKGIPNWENCSICLYAGGNLDWG